MAHGSLKDVAKSLNTAFAAPQVPQPLPDELQQTIDAFLERYVHIDDNDSQRLQEELVPVYQNYVANTPQKRGPFLNVLRQLRPAISGDSRLLEWWELVIRPTIDTVGHRRDEIEDARQFLLGIMVFDADDDTNGERAELSASFTQRLLDAYLARTKIPLAHDDVVSPEDEFIAHELETVLVSFGRKKPKELLSALDGLLVQARYRPQALGLLSAFVRIQPPHLHLVMETPLIQHLEMCLMIDRSATIVELALTVLIMFLPHITASLIPHLPRLFLIYSRLLCFEKFDNNATARDEVFDGEAMSASIQPDDAEADGSWERLDQSFDNAESTAPGLTHYFTFLYGLYPLNFLSFLRKPRKYLKGASFPDADDLDLDQDLIRRRTEPFRAVHLLHPALFNITIEEELEENRWMNSEPADVVTECMSLCIAVSDTLGDPGPPPTSKLPDLPTAASQSEEAPSSSLLGGDEDDHDTSPDYQRSVSWRNTQSTALTAPSIKGPYSHSAGAADSRDALDSPTFPSQKTDSRQEIHRIALRKSIAQREEDPASSEKESPHLEAFAQSLAQPRSSSPPLEQNLATLQREVMLLRNDLSFERYLKHQHLTHIGQLQRKHIKEATVEAETQNLINSNKALKAKLAKANELYTQLKKETQTGRSQSKRWEGELSARVRAFREEEKQWQTERESFHLDLQALTQDCDNLKKLVVESEARELNSRQNLTALKSEMEELHPLRSEVEMLRTKVEEYETRATGSDRSANNSHENLIDELQKVKLNLRSRDMEREQQRRAYERRVADLEAEIRAMNPEGIPQQRNQLSPAVKQIIDSALAASQSKLNQLRKTHSRLLHKYTELELRYQELKGEHEAGYYQQFQGARQDLDTLPKDADLSPVRHYNTARGSTFGQRAPVPTRQHAFSSDDDEIVDNDYVVPSSAPAGRYNYPSTVPPRSNSLAYANHQHLPPLDTSGDRDLAALYESQLNHEFQAPSASSDPPQSSGKSAFSVDSRDSKGDKKKEKVQPKSEMRVYGRGKQALRFPLPPSNAVKPVQQVPEESSGSGMGVITVVRPDLYSSVMADCEALIGGAQNIGKKKGDDVKKSNGNKNSRFGGLMK